MTEYSVLRWLDEIGFCRSEIVQANSLEDAVALLSACGDEILVSENGILRSGDTEITWATEDGKRAWENVYSIS